MDGESAGEALFSELRQRSEREVAEVLAHARMETAGIQADAETRRAERREQAMLDCARALEPHRAQALRDARRTAERGLLEAQRALIVRVVRAIRDLAAASAPPDRDEIAARLAGLLAYAAQGQSIELRARPEVAPVLTELVRESTVRVATDSRLSAGITLLSTDGALLVEDTVDAWLAANDAQLAIDICGLVEGSEDPS